MKRVIGSMLFVGIVSGCVSVDSGPETGGARPHWGKSYGPPTVPGVEGPYGTQVNMASPYNTAPPGSQFMAKEMMKYPVPMDMLQMNPGGMSPNGVPLAGGMPGGPGMGGMPGMGMPPGGPGMGGMGMPGMGMPGMGMPGMPPGGPGMGMPGMPPRGPGMGMPGMSGMPPGGISQANFLSGSPNSGVMPANVPPGGNMLGGVAQAQFANSSPIGPLFPAQRTQVTFSTNPPGIMKVHWYAQGKDGRPSYSVFPLETPGKYNFAQGAIYRLKLTHIPGHPALELYPTLEVVPTSPKTNEFLAHNSVPLVFSEADFKQVVDRNYIVKVIYLPDPQFQDSTGSGPDEIDSRRLEPGQDPIQEALRRGSILLVVRLGNIDQEVPNTPSMSTPPPGMKMPPMMGGPGMPGMPGTFQVPFFGTGMPGMPGLNPNLFPAPGGVGAEANRKPQAVVPPLGPLPGEPGNKGDLPFGPPPVVPAPPVKNEVNKLGPQPQLPPMDFKLPGDDNTNPMIPAPPIVPSKKVESRPPVAATVPAQPVSSPKSGITKEPTMPTIPEFVIPPMPTERNNTPTPPATPNAVQPNVTGRPEGLPAIPTPTLPTRANEAPASSVPTTLLPGTPMLPPIPDFLSGSDLPAIPPLPR